VIHTSEEYIELDVAASILGEPVQSLPALCKVLGVRVHQLHNSWALTRSGLSVMYNKLHPAYQPPEAA
jgi:hypothetical protein